MQEELIITEGTEEKTDPKEFKRILKKDTGRAGWGLILYSVIMYLIVVVDATWRAVSYMLRNGMEEMSEQMVEELFESGTSMILAVLIGLLVLWLFMGRRAPVKEMFAPKRRMTPAVFFQLLAVFMASQFVFGYVGELLEAGLNLIGYSAMESFEQATGRSQTFSMLLYASFAAPIAEELVYRGFVMEPLRRHGKLFAIVVSAVLFGVMHANLPQSMFAVAVGLVLGYTAMEYSVTWAIALHMTNNFVFAELLSLAGEKLGETGDAILSGSVILVFFIAGIIVLWKRRKAIREYIAENKMERGSCRYAFTTVPVLLFIVFNLLIAIFSLTPLT